MHIMNAASITKLGWCFIIDPQALWSRVLRSKYSDGLSSISSIRERRLSSNTQKGISTSTSLLRDGIQLGVENGHTTFFWQDKWLIDAPLAEKVHASIPIEEQGATVAAYWLLNKWDLPTQSQWLPSHILNLLQSVYLQNDSNASDFIAWKFSKSGLFSIKSTYQVLRGVDADGMDPFVGQALVHPLSSKVQSHGLDGCSRQIWNGYEGVYEYQQL